MAKKGRDEDARWLTSQVRPMARPAPKPISEVLSRLMTRRGYANVQANFEWGEAWRQAAGKLAAHTRPGRVKNGVLEIVIQDSATLQELTFQKKQLLAALSQLVPQYKLKDLRLKIGQTD
jgi:predicted nucleic acid-binding Zn ribbon protein